MEDEEGQDFLVIWMWPGKLLSSPNNWFSWKQKQQNNPPPFVSSYLEGIRKTEEMIPVPFSESAYSSQSDGASSPLPGLRSEWSTFQEKWCGPWPLEDSRELLLERMLLTEGRQVTKVTSSSSPPGERGGPSLYLGKICQSGRLLPDCTLWGLHSGSFSCETWVSAFSSIKWG